MPPLAVADSYRANSPYKNNKMFKGTNVINMLGSMPEGKDWALRALHPCDDNMGGGVKVPDMNAINSAAMEYRALDSIGSPSGSGNWDVRFLCLPLVDVPVVYATRRSGESWSYWKPISVGDTSVAPGRVRLRATSLTDHGTVAYFGDEGSWRQTTLYDNATEFRSSFRGITFHLNANALSNQGMVTAGQFGGKPAVDKLEFALVGSHFDGTINTQEGSGQTVTYYTSECMANIFKDIPTNGSQLVLKSPNALRENANIGVYMPLKFDDPVHDYQPPVFTPKVKQKEGGGSSGETNPIIGGGPIYILDAESSSDTAVDEGIEGEVVWDTLPSGSGADRDGYLLTSAGPVNHSVGMVIFEGIDNTATVNIKVRAGIEVVADVRSAWNPFMSVASKHDSAALAQVQNISRELAPAYPAEFNSLNMLLGAISAIARPLIKSFIPTAAGWLSDQL